MPTARPLGRYRIRLQWPSVQDVRLGPDKLNENDGFSPTDPQSPGPTE